MNNDNQPPRYATLMVATCNVLNLALPERHFYNGQQPYIQRDYDAKVHWLGQRFQTLNADVLAVQEVWDEDALRAAVGSSGLRYDFVAAPGAENGPDQAGAQGTPRVGLVTRLKVLGVESLADFPQAAVVDVPGLGPHTRFERPPLLVTLQMNQGQELHVITAHLKSKRPKFLQGADGKVAEDTDDPKVQAVASLRSLLMRAGEALALRLKVVELLHRTRAPLVLMGDLNDSPHSVTTQLIAATSQVAYDRSARDTALTAPGMCKAKPRCAVTWLTPTSTKATRRYWIKFWSVKSLCPPAATPSVTCAGWRCSTTTCLKGVTEA